MQIVVTMDDSEYSMMQIATKCGMGNSAMRIILNGTPLPEPSEDAISRKALINHIESEINEWGDDYDAEQILGDIEDMPSIQQIAVTST